VAGKRNITSIITYISFSALQYTNRHFSTAIMKIIMSLAYCCKWASQSILGHKTASKAGGNCNWESAFCTSKNYQLSWRKPISTRKKGHQ